MFVHAGELRRSELHSTLNSSLTVVCWSWICRLGSIEMGAFGPIGTLPLDHKSGSPESQPGLLPDINKPPLMQEALTRTLLPYWKDPALLKRLTGYPWWVEAVEAL